MKTVGNKLDPFKVTGVKPGFNDHEEKGQSAFETITEKSFANKWKVIYTYPKDFTFVCPTEIVGYANLAKDFADRDAVLLSAARRTTNSASSAGAVNADLTGLNHWQFADTTGSLIDQLGVREKSAGVAFALPSL